MGKRLNMVGNEREGLTDWLEQYKNDNEAVKRITDYLTRNKYAMPILSIQQIEPIDIRKMKRQILGFRVPISYMFLDKNPELLRYINTRTRCVGKKLNMSLQKSVLKMSAYFERSL